MHNPVWTLQQADQTLKRLMPHLRSHIDSLEEADIFERRLREQFPRLFSLLFQLYGDQYDFLYHLEQILLTTLNSYRERSSALRQLDQQREANPRWFQSEQMMGGVCYVDLFADSLRGIKKRIPYFKELGLTYLHLMPLFESPEENSDGGYAVSDYRRVNPRLGTMAELASLSEALRKEGISLVLDFVFNHTSNEHHWARQALAGEQEFKDFYHIFPDRTLPDQYERNLREIFPEQSPGNFTYLPELDSWVWTSFYSFQWDLNYRNPAVFNAMLGEMLFLANQGVEFLRLDAVAFIWKQLGTTCESLPQAHMLIQAYNALVKIAAPALYFKSEAIVHPDDVVSYISWEESPISYNPTLMALLWESLATRKVSLLQHSMSRRFSLAPDCAWVNYVRVHDDIGWTFADEDAAELWINGYDHRQFLNRFYTGDFPGTFATGVPFGYNMQTGDMRISGTAASLAGLEQAMAMDKQTLLDFAVRRILLVHSVIISAGGIPLLYLGDEIGTVNDYSYKDDPNKEADSRWVHRSRFNWDRAAKRDEPASPAGRIFTALTSMVAIRQSNKVFAAGNTTFFNTENEHVLGYLRRRRLLVLANFSEQPQRVSRDILSAYAPVHKRGVDLFTNADVMLDQEIQIGPLQFMWVLFPEPL